MRTHPSPASSRRPLPQGERQFLFRILMCFEYIITQLKLFIIPLNDLGTYMLYPSKNIFKLATFTFTILLTACVVGPDYHRPPVAVPTAYKETRAKDWCVAKPADLNDRGQWWETFHEPTLNSLESQLNISNQNIAAAQAQYKQARALVDQARAAYFPTLSASATLVRQKTVMPASVTASGLNSVNGPATTHTAGLDASWEPDIWGSTHRSVEANIAAAQSSAAQLAATRLSAQASLAQYYFELRGVDSDKQLLDATVKGDQKILQLTQDRYKHGVAALSDVVQARSQLENAQALAINVGINRAQYEHAIAVLIGKTPAELSLPNKPFFGTPPTIPPQLPSQLLERRPDIAAAERTMAQANAQIGVAIAAYYPNLSFAPTAYVQNNGYNNWFSMPLLSWAVGPTLAETLFDGGLRSANTAAARANYEATVAQYRQTVLAAFQDVEDNLASLRVLKSQAVVQNAAASDAKLALQLEINQYKAGTVAYSDVLTSQINAYNAEKSAVDVTTLRMTSTVGLIKALGGGWHASEIKN